MMLDDLIALLGASHVRVGEAALPFHTDERNRYHQPPLAVVFPQSVEQVAQLVTWCAQHHPPIAIIPQGGNTGLVGGCAVIPDTPSIIVNLSQLPNDIEVDPINKTVRCHAGVTLEQLHLAVAQHNLIFPLTLASQNAATIGGTLATNAGGTQVLRYGNMRDLCLGLEVVLASGEVCSNLNTLRKNNTGYDLKHVFIGAEGTLGIITQAVLKLYPAPAARYVALIAAHELSDIVQAFAALQQRFDAHLTAFEYISHNALDLVCAQFNKAHPFGENAMQNEYALLELSFTHSVNSSELDDALHGLSINNAVVAQSERDAQDFWHLREWISAAQKRVGKNIKHDISLPISDLAAFDTATRQALHARFPNIEPMVFGHVGDGNLHYNISAGAAFANSDELMAHEPHINAIVYEQVQKFNGSISAEHGIGLLKRDLLSRVKSPVELNLMRSIKQQLDPLNLMNPHKIFHEHD